MTWIDALKHDADARKSFESYCEQQITDALTTMRTAVRKNEITEAARAEGRVVAFETLRDEFTAQERQEAQSARYRANSGR